MLLRHNIRLKKNLIDMSDNNSIRYKEKNHTELVELLTASSGILVLTKFIPYHCQHTLEIQLQIDFK